VSRVEEGSRLKLIPRSFNILSPNPSPRRRVGLLSPVRSPVKESEVSIDSLWSAEWQEEEEWVIDKLSDNKESARQGGKGHFLRGLVSLRDPFPAATGVAVTGFRWVGFRLLFGRLSSLMPSTAIVWRAWRTTSKLFSWVSRAMWHICWGEGREGWVAKQQTSRIPERLIFCLFSSSARARLQIAQQANCCTPGSYLRGREGSEKEGREGWGTHFQWAMAFMSGASPP
jgi:hypothetical protein